jgi:hydroxyacylglutathione hydrolase
MNTSTNSSVHELSYVPIPAFQDNYIWLIHDTRNAVVVDPGEAPPVLSYLRQHGLQLTTILLTHHHQDHVGGVAKLLEEYPVPVFGPAREAIDHLTTRCNHGDRVHTEHPAMGFKVMDVPGHTSGHIAYYQAATTGSSANGAGTGAETGEPAGTPHLFCGDTLFASGCGRLFEGTPAQMQQSLDSLAALPEATLVHCAHEYTLSNIRFALACEPDNGPLQAWRSQATSLRERNLPTLPTTIRQEREVNPFLRVDQPQVRERLEHNAQRPIRDRLDAFTVMREWKNRF